MNSTLVLNTCRYSPAITSWQERFSDVHLLAVASEACCELQLPRPDLNKVDWIMTHEDIAIPVMLQLKTLVGGKPTKNGYFSYRVDRKLYDRFRQHDGYNRFILLLVLPPQTEPWLSQCPDELTIKNCLYWVSLLGEPALQPDDEGRVSVQFPVEQVASADWLLRIYGAIGEGKSPKEVAGC